MPHLAPHIDSVPGSGIRHIFELSSRLDDVISLVIGEPDVAVAPHIAEAAKHAWDADATDYAPNGGISPLRTAIVEKLARENDLHVDVERVWVTVGATQALYQAMTLTLAAGDEALIPDPGYTTFTMGVRMLDARPIPYSLTPERGFLPDIDELERLVTDRTRVLIVNSPSNPLGVVFPEAVVRELVAFAQRHDLWIVSDEVYEAFTYGLPHISPASIDPSRVLTVQSFSKTYGLTGGRVGYLVTPPLPGGVLRAFQEALISCVNTPAQRAAVAALEGPQDAVVAAAAHYRENLAAATALLDERGIRYREPDGAFYLWIDVAHASGGDVAAWAERFLIERRVSVAPGSAFGRAGEGWIRVCVAATRGDLLEGLRRLPAPSVS